MEYNISHCQVSEDEQKEVFDAMKSFPSGHAQVACFTATFLIVSLISILEHAALYVDDECRQLNIDRPR